MSAGDWPALAGGIPVTVCARRAVWGKVPGRRDDFGWIARSADFDRTGVRIEHKLALGAEDRPRGHACFWLARKSACFAVSCYPSGVADAVGRVGLEKQFLEWERDGSSAAAALLLLPLVETFKPEGRLRADAAGQPLRTATAVELPPYPKIDVASTLPARIEEGRTALRDAVKLDALAEMYTALLNDRRPAILAGVARPLPALALAALLLPLRRDLADRISMAGWIVSRDFDDAMRATWNLVVCDQIPASLGARGPGVTSEAQRLAAAVLGEDGESPKIFTSAVSAGSVAASNRSPDMPRVDDDPPQSPPPSPPASPVGSASAAPELGGGATTADERSKVLQAIERFAQSPSREWPGRPKPSASRVRLTPAQRDCVVECVRVVRAQLDTAVPDLREHASLYEARRAHLEYKVGLIRKVVDALDSATAQDLDGELRWSPAPAAARETSRSSPRTASPVKHWWSSAPATSHEANRSSSPPATSREAGQPSSPAMTSPAATPPTVARASAPSPAADDRRLIGELLDAIEALARAPGVTWTVQPPRRPARQIQFTPTERARLNEAVRLVRSGTSEIAPELLQYQSRAAARRDQTTLKMALIHKEVDAFCPGEFAQVTFERP